MNYQDVVALIGQENVNLLSHTCKKVTKDHLHLPSPNIINKRAGGMGLISGRKAFQRPMNEGVALLHGIQDVYLEKQITIA